MSHAKETRRLPVGLHVSLHMVSHLGWVQHCGSSLVDTGTIHCCSEYWEEEGSFPRFPWAHDTVSPLSSDGLDG